VDIFARKNGINHDSMKLIDDFNLKDRIHFYRPYLKFSEKNIFNKFGYFFYNLLMAFINNPVRLGRFLMIAKRLKKKESFHRINDVFYFLHGRKRNYEIIHCHFGPNGGLAALLKEIGILDGKIITTFHGYDMSQYIDMKGRNSYELLFRVGDMFLPVSERWKKELLALGCSESKIRVHRMGVELDRVKMSERTGENETVNVLSVARLVEKKGLYYGIRAVSEALKKHPRLRYRIIGDGPLREKLDELIDELGIAGKVEMLGWKSQEEVFAMLVNSDIFIAPSVTDEKGDQEGIPVTLMEAMAHGLPVLSTRHSGIPELVEDGVHGFLVQERDIDALAEKLNYLVASPEIRLQMGKSGRNFVVKNYDNEKLNENLVAMYESLCR
jgi:colanic acid/amylovoran biosynthesis glycosyltransferase